MVRLKDGPKAQLSEQPPAKADAGTQLRSILALAANTDDAIAWDRLAERMGASPPALSERDRVQLTLDLANGRTVAATRWNQLIGAQVLAGKEWSPVPLRDDIRRALVASLEVIVSGTDAARRAHAAEITKAASDRIVIVPSWRPDATREDRIVARSMFGALLYGLLLVLDRRRPFLDAVRRCHFSECQKFFLKARGPVGAPTRSYCSKPHAERGDTEKARLRMQRLRGTAK